MVPIFKVSGRTHNSLQDPLIETEFFSLNPRDEWYLLFVLDKDIVSREMNWGALERTLKLHVTKEGVYTRKAF